MHPKDVISTCQSLAGYKIGVANSRVVKLQLEVFKKVRVYLFPQITDLLKIYTQKKIKNIVFNIIKTVWNILMFYYLLFLFTAHRGQ